MRWVRARLRRDESRVNVKVDRLKAAATLRSHAAGSQDESPYRAIHKVNGLGIAAQGDSREVRSERLARGFQSAGTARSFAQALMAWMSSVRVTLRGWVLRTSARRMSVESCCFWPKAV